jgi:hypothetical protein
LGVTGVLVLAVGAWAGVVPSAAPAFRFSADGSTSWYWNLSHAALWLLPGATAVVAALVILGVLGRTRRGRGRIGASSAGIVSVVCGAWLVVGPVAWPVLYRSAGVFVPAGPARELAYQLVYSLGPGVLLAALGGVVTGWGLRGRAAASARGKGVPAPA